MIGVEIFCMRSECSRAMSSAMVSNCRNSLRFSPIVSRAVSSKASIRLSSLSLMPSMTGAVAARTSAMRRVAAGESASGASCPLLPLLPPLPLRDIAIAFAHAPDDRAR